MKPRECWEFVNATRGTVTEYVVMDPLAHPSATQTERDEAASGRLVFLRNPLTGGIAEIYRQRGKACPGRSHWRKAPAA
jgi:hypothetical protein